MLIDFAHHGVQAAMPTFHHGPVYPRLSQKQSQLGSPMTDGWVTATSVLTAISAWIVSEDAVRGTIRDDGVERVLEEAKGYVTEIVNVHDIGVWVAAMAIVNEASG